MDNPSVVDMNMLDKAGIKLIRDKIKTLQNLPVPIIKEHLRFAQIEQKEAEETCDNLQHKRARLELEISSACKRQLLKTYQVILIERMLADAENQAEEKWCDACRYKYEGECTYKPH